MQCIFCKYYEKKTILIRIANNKFVYIVHIRLLYFSSIRMDVLSMKKTNNNEPRREISPNSSPFPRIPSYSHKTALFGGSRYETCTSRGTWITARRDWKNFYNIIVQLLVRSKRAIHPENPIATTPETTRYWVQK